jgi:hypothetical protein
MQCNYSSAYSGFIIHLNVTALLFEVSGEFNARYTANMLSNTAHILQFTLCDLWSRDIQWNYSSAYSGLNNQLNVSAPLLEIYQQLNVRYTANLVPNTAHNLQFTLCDLCSRPYTKYSQHRIFRLQYSALGSSPAIGGISTIQWALYRKLGDNYSAQPPAFAIWTVVPDMYNVVTSPHIKVSVWNWKYLLCYWRYLDNSMRAILQTLCQIQRTSARLRYENCGPGHEQCSYISAYSGFNSQLNESRSLLEICREFNAPYTANMVPNTTQIIQITL